MSLRVDIHLWWKFQISPNFLSGGTCKMAGGLYIQWLYPKSASRCHYWRPKPPLAAQKTLHSIFYKLPKCILILLKVYQTDYIHIKMLKEKSIFNIVFCWYEEISEGQMGGQNQYLESCFQRLNKLEQTRNLHTPLKCTTSISFDSKPGTMAADMNAFFCFALVLFSGLNLHPDHMGFVVI